MILSVGGDNSCDKAIWAWSGFICGAGTRLSRGNDGKPRLVKYIFEARLEGAIFQAKTQSKLRTESRKLFPLTKRAKLVYFETQSKQHEIKYLYFGCQILCRATVESSREINKDTIHFLS